MAKNKEALAAQRSGFLQTVTVGLELVTFNSPTLFAFICFVFPPVTIIFFISLFFNISIWIKAAILVGGVFLIASIFLENFTFEVDAFSVINLYHFFTGQLQTFFPGFYFRYPWRGVRNTGSIIAIKTQKKSFPENYPSKDGVQMTAKVTYEYRPDPHNAITFESISDEVIEAAMAETLSSLLSSYIANQEAEVLRGNSRAIEKHLEKEFGVEERERIEEEEGIRDLFAQRITTPKERSYGVISERITLPDFDYSESYQKMLTDQKKTTKLDELALQHFRNNGGKATMEKVMKKDAAGNDTKIIDHSYFEISREGGKTMAECYEFAMESTDTVKTTHFKNTSKGAGKNATPMVQS